LALRRAYSPVTASRHQSDRATLNAFLIENRAPGRHDRNVPDGYLRIRNVLGEPSSKKIHAGNARAALRAIQGELCLCGDEITMFSRSLFSHPFVRKRAISLATTTLVATASLAFARNPMPSHHVPRAMPVQYVNELDTHEESPFLSENDTAINTMIADMTVKPTGDADRDFVALMVPLNRGAVDMARAEITHGHNEQLRELARQIIAARQQETGAAAKATGQSFAPSPTP
jgi:hypothetical protein